VRVSTTNEFQVSTFDCGPVFPCGIVAGGTLDKAVFGIGIHTPIVRPVIQAGRMAKGGSGGVEVVTLAMLEKALRFAAASVALTR
jgi:hypothetical protein